VVTEMVADYHFPMYRFIINTTC